MEKGRSRLPVTADAYGPTNSGVRRSLASRLPYCKHGSGEGGWKRSRRRLTVTAVANGQVNELRHKPRTSPAAHPTAVTVPCASSSHRCDVVDYFSRLEPQRPHPTAFVHKAHPHLVGSDFGKSLKVWMSTISTYTIAPYPPRVGAVLGGWR
jgi:hypothetical protein